MDSGLDHPDGCPRPGSSCRHRWVQRPTVRVRSHRPRGYPVNGAARRHCAAVLLIVASVLWWHRWIPALLAAGFVLWVILHRRLESDLGEVLGRAWRRAWPPRTAVLVLVLSSGTLAYWVSDEPITPKVLPIALNIVALSILLFGNWWTLFAHSRREGPPVGSVGARAEWGRPPDYDLAPLTGPRAGRDADKSGRPPWRRARIREVMT